MSVRGGAHLDQRVVASGDCLSWSATPQGQRAFFGGPSVPRGCVAVTGAVRWPVSSEEARRGFCGTCGSSLFRDRAGLHPSVHAGTLDAPGGVTLAGHIFVADKGDHHDLVDGLPQALRDDPELTTQVPT